MQAFTVQEKGFDLLGPLPEKQVRRLVQNLRSRREMSSALLRRCSIGYSTLTFSVFVPFPKKTCTALAIERLPGAR